ncbi:putative serine/threonine-protein kinase, partial [Lachnellula occidentalis]
MANNTYGTCPNGGLWYTCELQTPTFLGCCVSNPCHEGGCPAEDLRAAGMGTASGPDSSTDDGSYWPNVNCSLGLWYTCLNSNFQGCCDESPCADGCPSSALHAAAFKTPPSQLSSSSETKSTSSTPSTTSISTTASTASDSSTFTSTSSPTTAPQVSLTAEQHNTVPTGAIAGGAVAGGLALILIAIAFFWWGKRRQKQKQKALSERSASMETENSPTSDTPFLPSTNKDQAKHIYDASAPAMQQHGDPNRAKHVSTASVFSGPPAYKMTRTTPTSNQHEIDSAVIHEVEGQSHRSPHLSDGTSTPHFLDGTPLANSYHELLEEFSSKDLRSVGNYTLGRLIGKGSFGKVYLANHKLTNGSKVVLKSANKDDSNLAREIHHHRQFLHPHIARLYEVIVTENLVWLVLEYCPGDELYNYLLKNGPLPVEKVQKIFTQLVGAVSYVHNSSCVHRDLKLENILLDKHENVKLVDFGFTREYEGKASYLQTFCGTVCYSAPEMLKGEKYAGEKVDVWSLGVILYAILCGELPFDDDDDNITRTKILSSEPKWAEHLTPDAVSLLGLLLSKRPLLRPALSDILTHPFLAEHAPQQQAILKLQQPAPFATPLEKETLERMRSAGVDIDQVIENVLAKRCDALAGWWSLLIEKEERKQARRERKRREREAEIRASRRLSAASSRLERMAPTLQGVDEEGQMIKLSEPPRSRGRKDRRSAHYPELVLTDLPGLPEHSQLDSPGIRTPPPPIEKDSIRSASSSRHRRPIPPPKEGTIRGARSRGSTLQLVTSNPDLLSPHTNGTTIRPQRRRHQHAFINQLALWKHWILDNAKRAKSPGGRKLSRSTPDLSHKSNAARDRAPKIPVLDLRPQKLHLDLHYNLDHKRS